MNLLPDEYLKKINNIETKKNIILEDLKNTYINYKLYPDISEYENIYLNNKYNLENIQNDIFLLIKLIKNTISQYNNDIEKINDIIDKLKYQNLELNNKYKILTSENNASSGLNNQQNSIYNLNKYNLILTILSFFSIIFFYKKIYI